MRLLALAAALLLSACGGPSKDAPPAEPSANAYRLTFAGDTLLGDGAKKLIADKGYAYVLDPVKPAVRGDFVMVNLEVPITTLGRDDVPDSDRKWTYNMTPEAAKALVGLGIDAFGFANNHTLDRGPQGLTDTLAAAKALGVQVGGAGADRAAAEAPILVDTPHGRVAILTFVYTKDTLPEATETTAGVVFSTAQNVARGRELAAQAGAKYTIAFVHFRGSYDGLHGGQKRTTKLFAKEGYDLVVGHGPHIAHPVGRVADTMVLWSLGNFVFNTPGRFKHKGTTGEAIVATAVLGPGGFERLELGCIQADNQVTKYRTRPCDDAERGRLLELLGPMASMEGELAVVPWGAKE